MSNLQTFFFVFFTVLIACQSLCSQTLSEKKASMHAEIPYSYKEQELQQLSEDITKLKQALKANYELGWQQYEQNIPTVDCQDLITRNKELRDQLNSKLETYRRLAHTQAMQEPFGLMHAPNTTIEELIIDYGSEDYLYYIPIEIAGIKISLCSSLPIPRENWSEMLELILAQNGLGIKEVHPLIRAVYFTQTDHIASLKIITNKVYDLEWVDPQERVCFILDPERSNFQRSQAFLERFANPKFIKFQVIGDEIVLLGTSEKIKQFLKLYQFLDSNQRQYTYSIMNLSKTSAEEMMGILSAFFSSSNDSNDSFHPLTVLPLENGGNNLFLMGTQNDLERAKSIIVDIEGKMQSPKEKVIFTYQCQYSSPEDMAKVLEQVYLVMIGEKSARSREHVESPRSSNSKKCLQERNMEIPPICDPPKLAVNPKPVKPSDRQKSVYMQTENFIVDPKTGLIIIVVENEFLDRLKEIIKKVDVPKKMVRLELLLFEKKVTDQSQFGLNLLAVGQGAKDIHQTGSKWSVDTTESKPKGILDFFLSRTRTASKIPAYDIAYNFLISQEDVFIHSNPSVTTINQTPAVIDLVEEQSIDMGTVEDPRTGTISQTFVRAQYGIFIEITPTVNAASDEEEGDYITLETNITFDTTSSSKNDRPDVARRHIQNQVRIADGQTVILGGLRRKSTEDVLDKIPFLGDIPGVGKLFSYATQLDKSTEMFIFITPRVISDPIEDLKKLKMKELTRRPGDIPELLTRIIQAKEEEKERLIENSLHQLLNINPL